MNIHPNPYQPSTLIEAQATYYPHLISIFIPNHPFHRKPITDAKDYHIRLLEHEDDLESNSTPNRKETDTERSLRRTKKQISDYVLCNRFELFATFTFAKNRQDIKEKRSQMSHWLKNQRKRNGKFQYLIVPEFHKDQKSLHFHALFYGYLGNIRKAINPKTHQPIFQSGQPIYTLPEYTLGFTNAKTIAGTPEDQAKIASYIKKYITKDMPTFPGKKRYWPSNNLKVPKIEDNPEKWYELVKPDWQIETEHGRFLRFNVGSHPIVDMYWEAHQ
jgi:hypothetical protein